MERRKVAIESTQWSNSNNFYPTKNGNDQYRIVELKKNEIVPINNMVFQSIEEAYEYMERENMERVSYYQMIRDLKESEDEQ